MQNWLKESLIQTAYSLLKLTYSGLLCLFITLTVIKCTSTADAVPDVSYIGGSNSVQLFSKRRDFLAVPSYLELLYIR